MKVFYLFITLSVYCTSIHAQWVQVGSSIDGTEENELFGTAVSLSANASRLAIGARGSDIVQNGQEIGRAVVYEWNGSAWNQLGTDLIGESDFDEFGEAIALSANGNRVVVGAYKNESPGYFSGQVRVYEWGGTDWIQMGDSIDGAGAGDYFGGTVSISADGSRIAVGAERHGSAFFFGGHARMFEWDGSSWVQMGSTLYGTAEQDFFGGSVAMSSDGSRVAIGAYKHDGVAGADAGLVRVYDYNGTDWNLVGADIEGISGNNQAGYAVSLSSDGSKVAIGAPNATNGVGQIRVMEWDGNSWEQMGNTIAGQASGEFFGYQHIQLSGNGDRVVAGAIYNSEVAQWSGEARVFEWNGTGWSQIGADISGIAAQEQVGHGVSISADGNTIAVGAPRGANFYGSVQVLEISQITNLNDYKVNWFSLYPNPTSTVLSISSDKPSYTFSLHDMTGKLILEQKISTNKYQLNLSDLPIGVYALRFETENGIIETHHLVKQ